jgi:hypothetical protein
MNARFAITYSETTPESAEEGDYSDTGFIDESCTLREAYNYLRFEGWPVEASPSCLSFGYCMTDYATGTERELCLHFPRTITEASARRVARLFGVRS